MARILYDGEEEEVLASYPEDGQPPLASYPEPDNDPASGFVRPYVEADVTVDTSDAGEEFEDVLSNIGGDEPSDKAPPRRNDVNVALATLVKAQKEYSDAAAEYGVVANEASAAEEVRLTEAKEAHADADARLSTEIALYDEEIEAFQPDRGRVLKSWQSKVVAAIAIMASAIGQGMSGDRGANRALGIIMKGIDDDVRDQYAKHADKKHLRADVARRLDRVNQTFSDKEAAIKADTANQLGQFLTVLRVKQQQLEGTRAGVTATLAVQAGEQKRAQLNAEAAALERRGMRTQEEKDRAQESHELDMALKVKKLEKANRDSAVTGHSERVRSARAVMHVLNEKMKDKEWFDSVTSLRGEVSKYTAGGGRLHTNAYVYKTGLRTQLAKTFSRMLENGKMTDVDFEIASDWVPSPQHSKKVWKEKIASLESLLDALSDGTYERGDLERKNAKQ